MKYLGINITKYTQDLYEEDYKRPSGGNRSGFLLELEQGSQQWLPIGMTWGLENNPDSWIQRLPSGIWMELHYLGIRDFQNPLK